MLHFVKYLLIAYIGEGEGVKSRSIRFLAIEHDIQISCNYIDVIEGMAINLHPLTCLAGIFLLAKRARESPTQKLEVLYVSAPVYFHHPCILPACKCCCCFTGGGFSHFRAGMWNLAHYAKSKPGGDKCP